VCVVERLTSALPSLHPTHMRNKQHACTGGVHSTATNDSHGVAKVSAHRSKTDAQARDTPGGTGDASSQGNAASVVSVRAHTCVASRLKNSSDCVVVLVRGWVASP
jgi:hypothetical protein